MGKIKNMQIEVEEYLDSLSLDISKIKLKKLTGDISNKFSINRGLAEAFIVMWWEAKNGH